MAQSQAVTSPSASTSTSTVAQILSAPTNTSAIDMSRETTIASPSIPELSSLEKVRQKLQPLLLYVVSTAQFLDIVNGASVSVAIIPIADELKFSVPVMPWILNAYTIAFAGLLLLSGRLGDLFGHRRMFLFGLFWFATWALVVSFATSPIMFVIARALQGVGAAATVPTAMALIATNYPAGPERTKAFSIFAAFGGLGAVFGILMAGGLISTIGWVWIFRISAIAAYLVLIFGFLSIPVAPPKDEKPKVDYVGATTATLGITGVVYYITTGVEDGWASPKTLPVFIAGLVLLGAFIYTESKVSAPLMPFRIWKSRTFTASVVLAFVQMAMFQGVIYFTNMIFQEVYGWTAIQTALGFLTHSLLAVVTFTTMGRILPRLRLKPLILTGFLLRCVAALLLSFVTEHTSYWRLAFPGLILHVFGVGFSMLPIQITAVRDAENKDQGLVGAIYNTGLQFGAPFGLSILNVISIATNGNDVEGVHGGAAMMRGYKNAFYGIIAMGLFGFLLAMVILPWDRPAIPAKKEVTKEQEQLDLEVGSPMDGESVVDEMDTKVETDAGTIQGEKEDEVKA
ncbi:major facilitator superfamily domain-containing protein [Gamsiella multidivaricata]|uniref:major facilitator superfamily domain-containing protein n=1 Tax=Gamsiella multidivaricata TaxID=101098 RepID=UPI00221F04A3|nr:major facilitator superfamily domain-containing protein [Gamsiella multidivaricata]KAG0354726.1 hypothetical protein BGZ54_001510 [Gamsiella multidivaricata]KAI7820673.1 major facilitator superfamily domain-containing protein [Gamsiella multidivaricata]